jgi:S1-C subfamily serine protease
LAAGVVAGVSQQTSSHVAARPPSTALAPTSRTPTTPPSRPADPDQIAAAVDPAVVDINTQLDNGIAGAGTGMVLTSDGLVLTNNHVIADATTITAQVNGSGPSYQGDVIGYDITADVAVVQLRNASNLATVATARSSGVRVNDQVVALGNALGQGGTPAVASGSVTRLDQTITVGDASGQNQETLSGLIEVNVSLQPGDSGGPLLNLDAEVIGMNTAAWVSSRGGGVDLGYAIPIDDALAIAAKIATGTSSAQIHIGDRAMLGVQIDPVGPGAHILSVESGGPASMAGMTAGDTILSVDSTPVADGASVRVALDPYHPGDQTTIVWVDAAGVTHQASIALVKGPPA